MFTGQVGQPEQGASRAFAPQLTVWLPAVLLVLQAAAEGDTFDVHPSDLSPDLAAKLQALCMSGRLSHLVPQWQPWWLSEAAANFTLGATGQRVVAELGVPSAAAAEGTEAAAAAVAAAVADSGSLGGVAALPAPPDDPLPSLAVLAGPGFQASPLLPWQLLQLLVAYCAVMRRWNGEPDCRASTGPGWEAAQQLLLAPPLGQLLSTSSSTSSKSAQNAAAKAQPEDTRLRQRQDTTQHEVADLACVPADSARCALMQLAAAAAELAPNQGCSNADPVEGDADPGLASSAAELRSLLEMANSDALALLQLGRSAVLLALTDSCRLIEQSRQHLKQQWRHKQSKGKQGLQQQAAASTIGAAKQGRKGAGCSSGNSSRAAEDQLLQHLKLAARKLHFFTAWSNEQPPDMFEHLALQLAVELQEQEAMSKPQQGTVSLAVQEAQPLAGPSTTAVFPQMQPRLRAAAAGVALQQVQRQPEQQQRPQGTQQENEAQQLHVEGEQGQHGRKTATPAASLQGQPQQQEQLECWAGQLLQTEACNVSRAHQDGSRMQASSAGPALSVGGGPELSSRQVAEMTGLYELD